ncbi:EfeM/EfeO family lipoprotein [Thermoleophilia bacterium SCSIO 60948]|nr:EfeM/EfeO family lipoprotein [Thermoleophilia bacterium SCSIO 60948]
MNRSPFRRPRPGRTVLVLLALAATLLLAACGSDDGAETAEGGGSTATTASAGPAELSGEEQAAVDEYRRYAIENADELVTETDEFLDLVAEGDIEAAKRQYIIARLPFERIEPVAGALGDLDPSLDAREGDVDPKTWGGFHLFEKKLWVEEDVSGLDEYIDETRADVRELQELAPDLELTPADIAQGSIDLLGEVSASKITGEEERYSHLDLYDFEANVEGSETAFDAVAPLVGDPELEDEVSQRFADVYDLLERYEEGAEYVSYEEVDQAGRRELSQGLDALAEPLSQAAGEVKG